MQSNADERQKLIEDLTTARQAIARDFLIGALSALDASELTMIQLGTLMLLSDGKDRTVKDVAAQLGRSLSATSRLLDQLVRRKLLRRWADTADRRVRLVSAAAAGARLIARLLERRADAQLRLMDALSPRERVTVARGMALLADAARRKKDDDGPDGSEGSASSDVRTASVRARSREPRARRRQGGEPG